MSKESYIAESEALNKLFNNMTQRKVDAAEKEKLKKEENKGEQVEAKKPLQAAPTTSRPIHSEYLEKKKKEEEEAKRIEEARRSKMRKQIEKEEAEKAEQERKLAEERKKQEAERKKKEEERLANLFGVTAKKEPKPQSNPAVKSATKDEPVKEESLPVKDESKNETTESKTKEALHVFETVLNKTEENEQGPKDAEPEQKKVAPVIAKRIIHGMCGHTSDEWEYGFAGAIEAMRICTENNVKEIMFVVLDPLCEILQQNADGLRWGYSYTRSQFTKAIDVLKREAAIGFIPEHVESEFQDLAETIAKTLVFPVND